jgi:excisionase family DNA binding protein
VLTPKEVADRAGFSYHAILRAIRRGDLQAFEPVRGHYRIALAEYERWLHTPARTAEREPSRPRRRATGVRASDRGSLTALRAIEAKGG